MLGPMTAPDAPAGGVDGDPPIRVVRGTPTPEEVAALVGVLLTRATPAAADRPAPPSAWTRSARPGAMTATRPGPGAWRRSTLPR
jgi:hypothetical protein